MSKIEELKIYLNSQITIEDYFSIYHKQKDEKFKSYTHQDIKRKFPSIGIKDKKVVTQKELLKGQVVLVKDYTGIVVGYQATFENEDIEKESASYYPNNPKYKGSKYMEVKILSEEQIEDFNNHELAKLLKRTRTKRLNQVHSSAQRVLKNRSEDKSGSKRAKLERVRKKEKREDDLYD